MITVGLALFHSAVNCVSEIDDGCRSIKQNEVNRSWRPISASSGTNTVNLVNDLKIQVPLPAVDFDL